MAIPTPESYARIRYMAHTFKGTCQRSYLAYLELSRLIDEFGEVEYSEELNELERKKTDAGFQTIVFSAMSLEAAIFDFAAVHLGDDYVRDHLDKLDLLSKWVIALRFISGLELIPGKEPYNSIKQVVTARNLLVHCKSEALKTEIEDIEKQLGRIRKESEQLERDVHASFRALVLSSIFYETQRGRAGNPLDSFIQYPEHHEEPFPKPIQSIVAECKKIIAKAINNAEMGR